MKDGRNKIHITIYNDLYQFIASFLLLSITNSSFETMAILPTNVKNSWANLLCWKFFQALIWFIIFCIFQSIWKLQFSFPSQQYSTQYDSKKYFIIPIHQKSFIKNTCVFPCKRIFEKYVNYLFRILINFNITNFILQQTAKFSWNFWMNFWCAKNFSDTWTVFVLNCFNSVFVKFFREE